MGGRLLTASQMVGRLFFIGFGIAAAIILFVIATGQTFGQRCERMFPNASAYEHEACVDALSRGEFPPPTIKEQNP